MHPAAFRGLFYTGAQISQKKAAVKTRGVSADDYFPTVMKMAAMYGARCAASEALYEPVGLWLP